MSLNKSLPLKLAGVSIQKNLPPIFYSYGHFVWNFIPVFKHQSWACFFFKPQSLGSGLGRYSTHTHTLDHQLKSLGQKKKLSHGHGINSRDTIPHRIPLATKYKEEMYYYKLMIEIDTIKHSIQNEKQSLSISINKKFINLQFLCLVKGQSCYIHED